MYVVPGYMIPVQQQKIRLLRQRNVEKSWQKCENLTNIHTYTSTYSSFSMKLGRKDDRTLKTAYVKHVLYTVFIPLSIELLFMVLKVVRQDVFRSLAYRYPSCFHKNGLTLTLHVPGLVSLTFAPKYHTAININSGPA